MTGRTFNIGHVKFAHKEDITTRTELGMQAEAAGVNWAEMLIIVEAELDRTCKAAAHAQCLYMIEHWTPEQWQLAKQKFV